MSVKEIINTYGIDPDDKSIVIRSCSCLFILISMILSEKAGSFVAAIVTFIVSYLILNAIYIGINALVSKHKKL